MNPARFWSPDDLPVFRREGELETIAKTSLHIFST
jgi:hypothetical protein